MSEIIRLSTSTSKFAFRSRLVLHQLGVTFLKKPWAVLETDRQPYQAHYNVYRHPASQPAVYEVSVIGPYNAKGPGNTPSRDRIFVCRPEGVEDEESCVRRISNDSHAPGLPAGGNGERLQKSVGILSPRTVRGWI